MKEDEATREAGQDAATEPPLEGLQKTLHHIEAIKHILDVSGTRPEPLELTLRNLEKLLDKGPRKFGMHCILFRKSKRHKHARLAMAVSVEAVQNF